MSISPAQCRAARALIDMGQEEERLAAPFLAACQKARSASIHDRCKAVYGQPLP
jgi:hypothetical protein